MQNQNLNTKYSIFSKLKWTIGLLCIMFVACGCTISMQPVPPAKYFNYIEPKPYWYYPYGYYQNPTIYIHPKPRHNHNHHYGPRK